MRTASPTRRLSQCLSLAPRCRSLGPRDVQFIGLAQPVARSVRPLRVLSPGEFESFSKETSPNVREADGFTDASFSLLYSLSGKRKLTILSELFRYAPRPSYNPIPPNPSAHAPTNPQLIRLPRPPISAAYSFSRQPMLGRFRL